jgi:glutamate racemase
MEQAHRLWRVQRHLGDRRLTTLGVFDSGVGGLSVLRELLHQLPSAQCVYVADNAFAPYGERDVATIQERASWVTSQLREQHQIDALVIACNTATAHAVDGLRALHPDLPIVGVEPALKPAAAISATGQVGVLATRGTLNSARFDKLRQQVSLPSLPSLQFWPQACDGLADAIERDDQAEVQMLCGRYVAKLFEAGPQAHRIDTIVLGCTHYPFAIDALQKAAAGRHVRFMDTGLPVARRARELMGMALTAPAESRPYQTPSLFSTGDPTALSKVAQRWIDPSLRAHRWVVPTR